jgi:hypothetical protein
MRSKSKELSRRDGWTCPEGPALTRRFVLVLESGRAEWGGVLESWSIGVPRQVRIAPA